MSPEQITASSAWILDLVPALLVLISHLMCTQPSLIGQFPNDNTVIVKRENKTQRRKTIRVDTNIFIKIMLT